MNTTNLALLAAVGVGGFILYKHMTAASTVAAAKTAATALPVANTSGIHLIAPMTAAQEFANAGVTRFVGFKQVAGVSIGKGMRFPFSPRYAPADWNQRQQPGDIAMRYNPLVGAFVVANPAAGGNPYGCQC